MYETHVSSFTTVVEVFVASDLVVYTEYVTRNFKDQSLLHFQKTREKNVCFPQQQEIIFYFIFFNYL
jgi:hypothetical protein